MRKAFGSKSFSPYLIRIILIFLLGVSFTASADKSSHELARSNGSHKKKHREAVLFVDKSRHFVHGSLNEHDVVNTRFSTFDPDIEDIDENNYPQLDPYFPIRRSKSFDNKEQNKSGSDDLDNSDRFKSKHSCEMDQTFESSRRPKYMQKKGRKVLYKFGKILVDESPESAFECVGMWSEKAQEAFAGKCHGKVTRELLMCIFFREQRGQLTLNSCNQFGCGMAQMTGAGVGGVKRGLVGRYGLLPQYKAFFDLIGRSDLANENPQNLQREDALDMQKSVGMAATLLCAIHIDGAKDQTTMAERYNGNPNSKIRIPYRNFASQCLNDFKDANISDFTRKGILLTEKSTHLQKKYHLKQKKRYTKNNTSTLGDS